MPLANGDRARRPAWSERNTAAVAPRCRRASSIRARTQSSARGRCRHSSNAAAHCRWSRTTCRPTGGQPVAGRKHWWRVHTTRPRKLPIQPSRGASCYPPKNGVPIIPSTSLGLSEPISRRDFLNGALLAGAGLLLPGQAPTISPADAFNGYSGIGDYRHANGNTWEVLTAGHALRDGALETQIAGAIDTGEMYDLVAVGGGISGLAAAIFFQKYQGGRCLVIDNHPIFGGEAKRNEFLVDGQRLTAHQGSAIFLVPGEGGYTDRFYEMIGMDRSAFAYQTWRGPSPEMPLAHSPYETPGNYGFYFGPQFGQRPGGGGEGGVWAMDPWGRKLEGAPISDVPSAELLRWGTNRVDGPRPQTEGDAISRQLDSITLEDHLMARYTISRETVRTFLSPVEGGGY